MKDNFFDRIILEQISYFDFTARDEYWHQIIRPANIDRAHFRLVNPLWHVDYEGLLENLIEHPLAHQINVNDNGKWRSFYKREFSPELIWKISDIAKKDVKKENCLEFKFRRKDQVDITSYRDLLRLKIGEHVNRVIGYELSFPYQFSDHLKKGLINVKGYNVGIWIPSDGYGPPVKS